VDKTSENKFKEMGRYNESFLALTFSPIEVNHIIDRYNDAVKKIGTINQELENLRVDNVQLRVRIAELGAESTKNYDDGVALEREIENCPRSGCPLKKARSVSVGKKLADLKKLAEERKSCNDEKSMCECKHPLSDHDGSGTGCWSPGCDCKCFRVKEDEQ
jgi:hypothetical protein